MNYIGIDGRIYNDELYHHGVIGMKWGVRKDRNRSARRPLNKLGRFSSGSGGVGSIASRMDKIDNKAGKLQRKAAKYNEKAAKYNRKANKVKRRAANPVVSRTDLREAANYKALRLEGKGLKYTHKAERLNKKISKLDQEYKTLGKEFVKLEAEETRRFREQYYPNAPKGYH